VKNYGGKDNGVGMKKEIEGDRDWWVGGWGGGCSWGGRIRERKSKRRRNRKIE
jgi:hypothetical protein